MGNPAHPAMKHPSPYAAPGFYDKALREGRRKVKADPGSDALPAPHVLPGPAKQVVHA